MTSPIFKIRVRERRGRPREAYGEYAVWTEYQVVSGRRVVSRHDLSDQAQRWIDRAMAEGIAAQRAAAPIT